MDVTEAQARTILESAHKAAGRYVQSLGNGIAEEIGQEAALSAMAGSVTDVVAEVRRLADTARNQSSNGSYMISHDRMRVVPLDDAMAQNIADPDTELPDDFGDWWHSDGVPSVADSTPSEIVREAAAITGNALKLARIRSTIKRTSGVPMSARTADGHALRQIQEAVPLVMAQHAIQSGRRKSQPYVRPVTFDDGTTAFAYSVTSECLADDGIGTIDGKSVREKKVVPCHHWHTEDKPVQRPSSDAPKVRDSASDRFALISMGKGPVRKPGRKGRRSGAMGPTIPAGFRSGWREAGVR